MPSDEFREEPANPPIGSVPPPVAARGKKPNGEDGPAADVSAKPASGKEAKAKAYRPPADAADLAELLADPRFGPPKLGDPAPEDEPEAPLGEGNDYQPIGIKPGNRPNGETTPEDLDEDAAEFARLRRDLPNVGGSAAIGIVAINVVKAPPKNEFFRTMKGFRPIVDIVIDQVRLDQKFYAVDPSMAAELTSIGITYAPHTLYLIMTSKGALRVIPVRCPDADGDRNEYAATKELALREAEDRWLRIYTDMENTCYRRFFAPKDRFPEPVWPELPEAKIFRLCFRDRGYLIKSPDHPRFIDWIGRKPKDDGQ